MQKSPASKKQIGLLPIISLSLSMVVIALVIFLLATSISTLKKENAELRSDMASLKNDLNLDQQALDALKKQSNEGTTGLQGDVQNIKAQLDSVVTKFGDIERQQASLANPDFIISPLDLKYYSDAAYKYQSYTGAGAISTADTQDSFLVLLKKTLLSGGAKTTKPVEYIPILVVGGSGSFSTDDSAEGTVDKPDYAFEVIGYIRFAANDPSNANQ